MYIDTIVVEDKLFMDEPSHYQIVAFNRDGSRTILQTFFDRYRAEKEYEVTRLAMESRDRETTYKFSDWVEIQLEAVYRD